MGGKLASTIALGHPRAGFAYCTGHGNDTLPVRCTLSTSGTPCLVIVSEYEYNIQKLNTPFSEAKCETLLSRKLA